MSRDKRVYSKAETVILDRDGSVLARIDGLFWPPSGAAVELEDPHRHAVVREVRLRVVRESAQVCVTVEDGPRPA